MCVCVCGGVAQGRSQWDATGANIQDMEINNDVLLKWIKLVIYFVFQCLAEICAWEALRAPGLGVPFSCRPLPASELLDTCLAVPPNVLSVFTPSVQRGLRHSLISPLSATL